MRGSTQSWREAVCISVMAFGAIIASAASAATLRVERDGSGDYTVIQDAVDVAASGDTIRIGPGRFDERQLVTCPGWSEQVRVWVTQDTLTIIGSGRETIIGQTEPYDHSQGYHKGIVAGDLWDTYCLRVYDLCLENMRDAIYTSHESDGNNSVEIRNCRFQYNEFSLFHIGDGGGLAISECEFDGIALQGTHVFATGQSNVELRDCMFWLWDYGQQGQTHLSIEYCPQPQVVNCSFRGGNGGVTIHQATADIDNCTFEYQSNFGLQSAAGSHISIRRSAFRWQARAVISFEWDNTLQFETTVFQGISHSVFALNYAESLRVNQCDLADGTHGVVWGDDFIPKPIKTFDMENNYWGTDDPQAIRDLIHDRSDTTSVQFVVDFEPFATESTPVERKRLGDVKASFR